MAFALSQAKSLCTASELTLVKASMRNEIGKFTVAQIRKKVDRARKLRDKWRDQSRSQRRAKQTAQRSRQTDTAARSAKKAELFGEVLGRFEAQLTKLEGAGKKGRPAPKRLPKRARSATHRADRADLKEERAAMGSRKRPRPPKPKNPAEPLVPPVTIDEAFGTAEGATTAERPAKPTVPAARAGKGKRAHAGLGMTALESAREFQGLHVSKGKQIRVTAAAKQERLKEGGKKRIQMHASARTRRRQGKRDAR